MPFSEYDDLDGTPRIFNEDDTVVIRRLIKPVFPSSVQVPDIPEYQSDDLICEVRIENGNRHFLHQNYILIRTYQKLDEQAKAEYDKKMKYGSSRKFSLIKARDAIKFLQAAGGEPIPELLEIAYANLDASSGATVLQDSAQEVEATTDTKATTSQPDKGEAKSKSQKSNIKEDDRSRYHATVVEYVKWAESLDVYDKRQYFSKRKSLVSKIGLSAFKSHLAAENSRRSPKPKLPYIEKMDDVIRYVLAKDSQLMNRLEKVIAQARKKTGQ